jgi:hypothetical protein
MKYDELQGQKEYERKIVRQPGKSRIIRMKRVGERGIREKEVRKRRIKRRRDTKGSSRRQEEEGEENLWSYHEHDFQSLLLS